MIGLSFGGGRQTTALLVLAIQGEVPKPDVIAFADTGWEYPETYDYIARHIRPLLSNNGLSLQVVKGREKGFDNLYDWYWHYRNIPGLWMRSCTDKYKVRPIMRLYKSLGVGEEWIGFSFDEQGRAARKMARPKNRFQVSFPLIENKITVTDCEYIIDKFGLPLPPKSSCIFCPYQRPWRVQQLYKRHPNLFERVALLEDRALDRKPGFYILGNRPWRSWANIQLGLFGEDWNYGCQDGYCFR